MRAVVFLGPSRPTEIALPDGIEVLPPAAAGDIFRATRRGVGLIALIDARFQDLQTVQHKEILHALENGVHVWGAASMGALRAAECEAFGMRGFGEIFAMYRDGVLVDDHEVAVVHGPARLGYPALNEPMVNVRATLTAAQHEGLLSAAEAHEILGAAQAIFYRDLTWQSLAEAIGNPDLRRKLDQLAGRRVDQKKRDAAVLLTAACEAVASGLAPFAAEFELQRTHHWRALEARFTMAEDTLSQEEAAVLDELRLDPLRYRDLLLRAFAKSSPRDVLQTDVHPDIEGFRADVGLGTARAFQEWLDANGTTAADLARALAANGALEDALEETAPRLAGAVLDELRIEDGYAPLLERSLAKAEQQADRGSPEMPADFAAFDLRDLICWFCESRHLDLPAGDADAVARSLGLTGPAALHKLLRGEFEFVRAREDAA